MADDLELAIVISATDDASQIFDALVTQAAEDFSQLSADLSAAQEKIDSAFGSLAQSFASFEAGAGDARSAIAGVADDVGNLDGQLNTLEASLSAVVQSLAQLQSSTVSLPGFGDFSAEGGGQTFGGDNTSLPDLFGFAGDAATPGSSGSQDLLAISQQQLDSLNQLVNLLSVNQGSPTQSNNFFGVLDSSTIEERIIPELERAVTRGTTSLF